LVSRGAEQRALDPIESALLTLLERHPTALVFAILGEGVPKPVPVPDTVPTWGHEFVDAERKLMDEIIPADRVLVAKLWGQARTQGAAVANVRLVSDPDQASNLYLLDVRPQHGVMVGLYTPGVSSDGDPIVEAARLPMLPPRVARAVKDTSAVITWVDPALSLILGWTPEELIGQRTIEFVHPDDRELGIATWMEMLESSESTRPVRLRHRHRDGSWVWLEVTNTRRYGDGDGDVLSEMLDVSEEMATVDALRAREQLLGQLTETVPVGLFHMDLSGNLLFANRRLHQMIGTSSEPRLVDQLAQLEPEDRIKLLAAVNAAAAGAETDVAVRVLPDEGGMRHCAISIRPLRDDHATVTGLTGCVEDVTDSVRSRTELEAKAISDPLTGCLNRAATLAVLQEALDCVTLAETNPTGTAVIFVDLDRFKPVNDQYGHAAGDEILIRVAERIRGAVRSGDVVGRLGGDEFLVICPRVADPETALAIAYSLTARSFGSRFDLEGTSLEIRASLGVAWSNVRGTHAAGLVAEADAAMYRSKRDGRAKPVMFIDPPLAAPPSEGPDAAVQSARSA
jgi:diguanylate cyclase (GGDEF)-like protein/PAS domain S-box-containing protein